MVEDKYPMRFFSFDYSFKIYISLVSQFIFTMIYNGKRPTIFKNTIYYKFQRKMLVDTFLYF